MLTPTHTHTHTHTNTHTNTHLADDSVTSPMRCFFPIIPSTRRKQEVRLLFLLFLPQKSVVIIVRTLGGDGGTGGMGEGPLAP